MTRSHEQRTKKLTEEQEYWEKHSFKCNEAPTGTIKLWNGVPHCTIVAKRLNVDPKWLWNVALVSPEFLRELERIYKEICDKRKGVYG